MDISREDNQCHTSQARILALLEQASLRFFPLKLICFLLSNCFLETCSYLAWLLEPLTGRCDTWIPVLLQRICRVSSTNCTVSQSYRSANSWGLKLVFLPGDLEAGCLLPIVRRLSQIATGAMGHPSADTARRFKGSKYETYRRDSQEGWGKGHGNWERPWRWGGR